MLESEPDEAHESHRCLASSEMLESEPVEVCVRVTAVLLACSEMLASDPDEARV